MATLDSYGVVAAASVLLTFYFVRKVGAYIKTCIAIVLATGIATSVSLVADTLASGVVLVAGTALLAFGLLFVRIMFIRSVSLNMLRSIQNESAAGFGEDIGGRLRDMRAFRLIRTTHETQASGLGQEQELQALTAFGRLIGTVTAVCHWLLRVKA